MKTSKSPFLSAAHINIIKALLRFRYLSSYQLARLLYPPSLGYVQNQLTSLVKLSYADYLEKPRTGKGGKPLHIYYLTPKGYRYLKQKPRKPASKWSENMAHTESSNDMVILGHEYARVSGRTVSHYLTEQELKTQPSGGVSPDGVLVLESAADQYPLVFEIDRDTEEREAWEAKFRRLSEYTQYAYKVHVPSEYLTIAIVLTVDNPRRLTLLRNWCNKVVPPQLQDTFLFACFDPGQVEPTDVFTQSIWLSATDLSPSSLIQ